MLTFLLSLIFIIAALLIIALIYSKGHAVYTDKPVISHNVHLSITVLIFAASTIALIVLP